MARLSNKSIAEILSSSKEFISFDDKEKELDRKITLATEGFTTEKYPELVLRDRTRLSKENALTLCNYIIDYKREINLSLNTIRSAIQHLSELSKAVGIEKKFADMTREDILLFLDHYRKLENDDPMHKWINTYNSNRSVVLRFFKWLHFPEIGDPKKRDKLSAETKEPKCIQDIPKLKRREVSSYKPSDMWTPEDDLLFLKYVTNTRDRCFHMMSRDLSARPHEILNLKIKDVDVFKLAPDGKNRYAEVLLNGKTGPRSNLLFQSIPYIKDWLSDHPNRNNPNSPLFVSMNNYSNGRKKLARNSLFRIYDYYKKVFFPRLLDDPTISHEDKDKIKALLTKPWNPYTRRHSGLTEKAGMLKEVDLRQHAGWSPKSDMPQKYIHYFGNESSGRLLEAYGIVPKNSSGSVELLSPKACPNCNEGNTADAKFCAKCRMVLTLGDYNETLQQQKEKELEIQGLQQKYDLLKEQVEENKRSQLGLMEWVAGIRKHLGIPADKAIVWDWTKTKQGQISFCEEEEYNSKHKLKGPIRYYHKPD
jgi:integrase/recombinase XerD